MSLWTTKDVARAVSGEAKGDCVLADISIDSRSVKAGDLFIALQGPNFDGHDYVQDAFGKGAAAALVSRRMDGVPDDKAIFVKDTFEALHALGAAGRARSLAKILAVTGSVGKTGCKEALKQVLAAQAPAFANPGSFNNHWGAPLSLARLPQEAKYGVFELGMNHVGELGPLAKVVQPHIALITTIAPVHIANFASLDEVAGAKAEIFEGLVPGGAAVLNADNAYYDFLKKRAGERGVKSIHGFGTAADAHGHLDDFTLEAESSRVNATILGKKITYTVGVPGEHWVMNSLAVLLTAVLAGADMEKAAASLGKLELAYGRGVARDIKAAFGRFTLIDESYNASPIAVEMAIKVLAKRSPGPGGRRILALGDMRELGTQARDLHVALAKTIVDAGIDRVHACGELMKHLFDALPESLRGYYAFTADALAPVVTADMRAEDIITVKGSNSVGMKAVVAALDGLEIQDSSKKVSHA
jgi:UDP-N-acetylmuramoyl-tripeptide--D-alanyl-D-alanine ligase